MLGIARELLKICVALPNRICCLIFHSPHLLVLSLNNTELDHANSGIKGAITYCTLGKPALVGPCQTYLKTVSQG